VSGVFGDPQVVGTERNNCVSAQRLVTEYVEVPDGPGCAEHFVGELCHYS
jgi:hypothetical protein